MLLPRLESDLEADTALSGAMWISFVCGFLGWLGYFWQGRPNAGILMFALFVVAGFGIRAGSPFAVLCLFAFFAVACAACIASGGWALSLPVWWWRHCCWPAVSGDAVIGPCSIGLQQLPPLRGRQIRRSRFGQFCDCYFS